MTCDFSPDCEPKRIFSLILVFALAGGNQSKTLVISQKNGSHRINTTDVN